MNESAEILARKLWNAIYKIQSESMDEANENLIYGIIAFHD